MRTASAAHMRSGPRIATDRRIAVPVVPCSMTLFAISQGQMAGVLGTANLTQLSTIVTRLIHNLIDGKSAEALLMTSDEIKDGLHTRALFTSH